ncbi:hypothetical protein [Crocosphaera chwakensis]|uniref:Uncharacterized protein n=1 Tax=Crocosphaera chwakensis CCY0110 TaxID=391612 RepID=A3IZP1_9CHRO|nr:hypothetical protein [Crocosphaera chwakensis]EAZ88061.1 hypothetical protein CY0110_00870 [Crocosphaera chwakensis CCY0110]
MLAPIESNPKTESIASVFQKLLQQISLLGGGIMLGIATTLSFAPPALSNTNVTVNPWGMPMIMEFDPNKSPGTEADPTIPGDLPGPPADENGNSLLREGEDAFAQPFIQQTFMYQFNSDQNGKITITSINVTVSGKTVIHLPNDADDTLKEHENGHDTLNKEEYTKRIEGKLKDSLRDLMGSMYVGEGNTLQEKINNAKAKAEKAINDRLIQRGIASSTMQMDTLGKKYDKLTDHGKSDTVDTDEGVKEAIKERNKAPKAGKEAKKPEQSKQMGSTSPSSSLSLFDSNTNRLSFGGDTLLTVTNDPTDPIIGRGQIQIDPMLLIGVQENGTVHLSDTSLQIVDTTNDSFLMDAFLFELAYIPSSSPDFAGMIQGYLDIPPVFAEGINNSIESPFLSGMLDASIADELTTFWFFADQPLFDSQGLPLIGSSGVTGSLKIGVAQVPESTSTISLFALGSLGAISTFKRYKFKI